MRCCCHGQPTAEPAPTPNSRTKANAGKANIEALRRQHDEAGEILARVLFKVREFPEAAPKAGHQAFLNPLDTLLAAGPTERQSAELVRRCAAAAT